MAGSDEDEGACDDEAVEKREVIELEVEWDMVGWLEKREMMEVWEKASHRSI